MSVTIDSTNPRVIADNIRKLDDAVQSAASELPEVETTDEGKVLTVNASGKWAALNLPPYPVGNLDYSTTEQNTGVKWIDGKNIYFRAFNPTLPSETGTYIIVNIANINYLYGHCVTYNTSGGANNLGLNYAANGNFYVSVSASNAGCECIVIIYYTKPDPAPGTREPDDAPDAEPELKKVTKKKTTKKEEE